MGTEGSPTKMKGMRVSIYVRYKLIEPRTRNTEEANKKQARERERGTEREREGEGVEEEKAECGGFARRSSPPAEKRPAVSKGRARVLSLVFFYLSRASSSSSSSSSLPLPAVLSSGLPLSASPSSSLLHARRFFAINLEARQKPAVERMLVRERGRERQLSQLVPRASIFLLDSLALLFFLLLSLLF